MIKTFTVSGLIHEVRVMGIIKLNMTYVSLFKIFYCNYERWCMSLIFKPSFWIYCWQLSHEISWILLVNKSSIRKKKSKIIITNPPSIRVFFYQNENIARIAVFLGFFFYFGPYFSTCNKRHFFDQSRKLNI